MGNVRARIAALASLASTCACGPDPKPTAHCPDVGATFAMVVSCSNGASLPKDLVVEVQYGGGVESYRLAAPERPRVLFCSPGLARRSTATEPVATLRCELWTQGPATVELQTLEYPKLIEQLTPDPNGCTRSVALGLAPPDPRHSR
jgi:hypothetical protein